MQNTQTFQLDNTVLEETQSPLSPSDFSSLAFTYTYDSSTYADVLSPTLLVGESKTKYKAGDRAARREAAEEKTQALKRRIDTHLTELHESLKNGHSDKVKELLAYFATFHHYSLGNQILIAFQRPDAMFVAGYKAWEEKGRTVKKGEHGIAILAPMIGKRREEGENKDNHAERRKGDSDDQEPVVFGFRAVYVFDVTQTEGEPLPAMHSVTGEASSHLDRLIRYTIEQGITLEGSAHETENIVR
jgi:N-terminal domain of anti-restriction factor ArdC